MCTNITIIPHIAG